MFGKKHVAGFPVVISQIPTDNVLKKNKGYVTVTVELQLTEPTNLETPLLLV